jgi:hypothetical protein
MTRKLKLQYTMILLTFAVLAVITWFALEPPRFKLPFVIFGVGVLFCIAITVYRTRRGDFDN